MSDPRRNQNPTELGQLQTNEDVPDKENVKDVIQQVHQANDDETRVDILPEIDSRCFYRVSPHLRASTNQQVYDPMVVSLGPYQHGKPQFHQMEELKEGKLNQFINKSLARDPTKDKDFFLGEIMKGINILRKNYEEVDEYTDEALVDIILRDACFLISVMEEPGSSIGEIVDDFGIPPVVLLIRDLNKLENQIPFWVIKRLLYLRYDKNKADRIVYKYLNFACSLSGSSKLTTLPWSDDGIQPLHLLDAKRTALLKRVAANETRPHFLTKILKCMSFRKTSSGSNNNSNDHEEDVATNETQPHLLTRILNCMTFWKTSGSGSNNERGSNDDSDYASDVDDVDLAYSVTFLQAKGIYIRTSSQCLQDIAFTSYYFYGVLRLPILPIDFETKVLFSNFVAFEMSPRRRTYDDSEMMVSYISFLKSFIDTSEDVNELRQRGILVIKNITTLNDEKVVKLLKEIDTFEVNNLGVFAPVRRVINKHCRSKTKTWMADLYHNYFRSPWTVIAVFAATFVLCLTFIQTYFAIHPKN